MPKLICPVCESKFTLEQAARETALRELVDLAARFGRTWGLANEYVECFRAERYGSITLKKRVRLLREVLLLWENCQFAYNGKGYRATQRAVTDALNLVCNMDKFGFQNHNYLKKVLLKGAEKLSAEGLTAKEEQKREEYRRQETGDRIQDDALPAAEMSRRARELLDRIGKGL